MIDWNAVAAVLTASAALTAALAWPFAMFLIVWIFRTEVRAVVTRLPALMDRVDTVRLGMVEAQLRTVAESVARSGADNSGGVTSLQVQTAIKIQEEVGDLAAHELSLRMDRLAREYELLRRTMPPGSERTRSMTAVLVQMRALGPAVASNIDAFKVSGSPGSRLAAIAIMQMKPEAIDLAWLVDRFRTERPFVFYHAALAFQNAAHDADPQRIEAIRQAARQALEIVTSYHSTPDAETVAILSELDNW